MKNKFAIFCIIALFAGECDVNAQTYRILVIPEKSNDFIYVDLSGKTIFKPSERYCKDYTPEGTALTTNGGGSVARIFDIHGNKIIPEIEFKMIVVDLFITSIHILFSDGIIRTLHKGMWGGIDCNGRIAIPFIYDEMTDFNGGFALAKRDKSYYVVDKRGNEILIEGYQIISIKHFSEGLAPVEVKGEIYGFIDTSGNWSIKPQFKGVGFFSADLAWARVENDDIGFIDKKGQWAIQPKFKFVQNFDPESGLALVKDNAAQTKGAFVDKTGTIKSFDVTEMTYDFSEGLAIGKSNDKYGYFNNQGEWVINPIFSNAYYFKNGFAAVQLGKYWGLIDKKGNTILPPNYKYIGEVVPIKE